MCSFLFEYGCCGYCRILMWNRIEKNEKKTNSDISTLVPHYNRIRISILGADTDTNAKNSNNHFHVPTLACSAALSMEIPGADADRWRGKHLRTMGDGLGLGGQWPLPGRKPHRLVANKSRDRATCAPVAAVPVAMSCPWPPDPSTTGGHPPKPPHAVPTRDTVLASAS